MGQQQKGNVLPHQSSIQVLARLERALPAGADCGSTFDVPPWEVPAGELLRIASRYKIDWSELFASRASAAVIT